MNIEYEATFTDINKNEIRKKLRKNGAKLIKPEFLQKRTVFHLPKGHEIKGGWVRVRDEQDKVTMSLKIVDGNKIKDQKEICLKVDNFKEAEKFLITLGCKKKAYQENKRELWKLDNVEIMIDEWPFLEPFIEVEGKSEKAVKLVCKKLELNYSNAIFSATDVLIQKKYGISLDRINNRTPKIIFNMKNPFLKK